jgi:DNA-binding CsgD family transcriptional regulator/DNA-binding winged helix-turn-helix (wHTH) protein
MEEKPMKVHRRVLTPPGTRETCVIRLLLVGRNNEFDGHVTRRIFDTNQPWIVGRAPTLLGALDLMQSDAIDVVLLGRNFRGAELELFVADARRNGFEGLILQAAVRSEPSSGRNESRTALVGNRSFSFTPRQKAVLAGVCKGWTNHEIASHLKCSEGAVKAILQQLFEKIGVRKRTQIVRLACEKELVDADESLRDRPVRGERIPNLRPLLLGRHDEKKPISIGHFVLDIVAHRVWVRGVETHLTPKEFWLLAFFATHPGELVESRALCEFFWRNPTSKHDALRVLIAALRAKIELSKIPEYLVTERSYGYRFNPFPALNSAAENNELPSGMHDH